ncbi:MAG: sulfatase-like hydrolase/transferase [Treponema sp.]|nr:sulfatase-like hydrolase/transferase [Treponema sp.]
MNKKPNIVIFMMDQLAAKWIEAGIAGAYEMPNFKRLMSSGTYFSSAITNNPVCMPARATIATGLSCRAHGVTENGVELDPAIPTFMQILQQNGYRTGNFGKLHFKTHYNGPYHDYKPYGFDEVFEVADLRAGQWLDWVEEKYPDYYEKALSIVWPMKTSAGMRNYGPGKIDLVSRVQNACRDNPKEYPIFNGKAVTSVFVSPLKEELTPTAWITMHGTEFIKQNANKQPFFAQLSYVLPHDPFQPPKNYLAKVHPEKILPPVPDSWKNEKDHPGHFDFEGTYQGIPDFWRVYREYYFACISFLDSQLGKVFDVLEQTGVLENTYIILLADHGELLYDHGFVSKHNRHYDACIRVPLIISGPELKSGAIRNEIVQLEDIMPTVLEMASCPPPMPKTLPSYRVAEDYPPMLAGNSLIPLCRGQTLPNQREYAYVESFNYWKNVRPEHWCFTVRNQNYRYTYYPQGGGEQLFDLMIDRDETKNLSGEEAYRDVKRGLRDVLLEKLIMQDSPKNQTRHLFYHEHP